jgi:phage protein U
VLGIRPDATANHPTPSQPTFCRLYARVSALEVEQGVLAFQRQVRGAPPPDELIVLDGKAPRHTGGQQVLTALTVPGQHYLGSEMIADKSNEIPAARALFARLELDGREVSLDALHTQTETARALVLEHGGDFLLTAKGNQPAVQANIESHVATPPVAFPP